MSETQVICGYGICNVGKCEIACATLRAENFDAVMDSLTFQKSLVGEYEVDLEK
jgi:hypothetical protein